MRRQGRSSLWRIRSLLANKCRFANAARSLELEAKRKCLTHARNDAIDPKRKSRSLFDHLVGAPGITAATPSGLMLKAKNVKGVSLGFPH